MFGLVDCHLTAEILKQEAVGDILGLSLLPLQSCILRLFLSPTSWNKIFGPFYLHRKTQLRRFINLCKLFNLGNNSGTAMRRKLYE